MHLRGGKIPQSSIFSVRETPYKAFPFSLTQTQGLNHLARTRLRSNLGL